MTENKDNYETEIVSCIECDEEVQRIVGDSGRCTNNDCEVVEFKLDGECNQRFLNNVVIRNNEPVLKYNLENEGDQKCVE